MSEFELNDDQLMKAAMSDLEDSSEQKDFSNHNHKLFQKYLLTNLTKNAAIVIIALIISIFSVGSFINYLFSEYRSDNEYETTYYQNYTEEITDNNSQVDNKEYTETEDLAANENIDSNSQTDNKEYIETENLAANEIADLYYDLGLKNPIQCSYVYCILLEEHHFSKGEFQITDNNLCDYEYALGYDVLLGKGVCRNVDDLFRLSMEKAGYDIKSTTAYSCENSLSADKNNEPNHQVSIINDNDCVYVLDVTNAAVLDNYSNEFAIYYDYDGNLYNSILPEYSLYEKNYLTSYNSENDVDLMNEWMASDTDSIDVEFIDEQEQEVCNLLNTTSAKKVINNFDLDYKNNILSQIN